MLEDPRFQKIFEFVPGLYLVLAPSLHIVAVSESYLAATMTQREFIIEKHLFEVFPDNPDDPAADGVRNLRASLETVIAEKQPNAMPVQKYDVRRPAAAGGEFEVRYWSPYNLPVLDDAGDIQYIIHAVEDVTDFIRLRDSERDRERTAHELLEKNESMQVEIYRRAQQVAQANRQLLESNRALADANRQLQDRNSALSDANELLGEAKKRVSRLLVEYERAERIAARFQEAALPPGLPEMPGFRLDAYYRPGTSDALIGGDWYDAVRLADGRLVISIGDVGGSGLSAAVIMATMRQVIRGVSYLHPDPVMILDAANKALQSEHPAVYVTAFVGIIDPVEMVMTYASAGHPAPVLRHADGRLEELESAGCMLGIFSNHVTTPAERVLPRDAKIILYTDGLIEATHDNAEGEQALYSALQDDRLFTRNRVAEALYNRILEREATDDVAIFVVHVDAAPLRSSIASRPEEILTYWKFDANLPENARQARSDFADALALLGADTQTVYGAELVFGELLGNVVRHASGMSEIFVDWTLPNPVLHVIDTGPGFTYSARLPHDLLAESGRGLFLIDALTADFNVTRCLGGGSHARAVIALSGPRGAERAH